MVEPITPNPIAKQPLLGACKCETQSSQTCAMRRAFHASLSNTERMRARVAPPPAPNPSHSMTAPGYAPPRLSKLVTRNPKTAITQIVCGQCAEELLFRSLIAYRGSYCHSSRANDTTNT
eukprot:240364-Pyramimonas_sp.AAC.1